MSYKTKLTAEQKQQWITALRECKLPTSRMQYVSYDVPPSHNTATSLVVRGVCAVGVLDHIVLGNDPRKTNGHHGAEALISYAASNDLSLQFMSTNTTFDAAADWVDANIDTV